MIRVLVADDHAVLREGICALLGAQPDLEVVAQAENGAEAVERACALRPDIVVMDISMPGMDGLEATRLLHERAPECRVLVLTQHENKEYVLPLLQAGAAGYLLKKAGGAELVTAIRAVYTQGGFIHPAISQAVMSQVRGRADGPRLTEREREILILVAEGLTSREIAARLTLSEKTVMVHRNNMMEKLDLHHTADLVRYAIREGLVKP